MKKFHVRDGLGIELWHEAGFTTCIITDDKTNIVNQRAQDLKINYVFTGIRDKLPVFNKVLKENNLDEEEAMYIGDDLPDLPIMKRAGLAIAVSDATEEVIKTSHCVTTKKGGHGAVRELIDFVLSGKNRGRS